MCARPFPTHPRRRPDDQFGIDVPPARGGSLARHPPVEAVADSYLTNLARVWLDDAGGRIVDVVPTPGSVSDGPEQVFGEGAEVAYFVSGQHPFGRPCTRAENAETLRRLRWLLDFHGWTWCRSTVVAGQRDWVEQGALIRHVGVDEVVALAQRHGQDVVLRWDADGFTPIAARDGVDLPRSGAPVPVSVRPALTGCPFRGGVDDWCVRWGGPFTSRSITASLVWETHRAMLVDALGCDVCGGGPVAIGGPKGATDLFTPSRQGGWQWGSPRTSVDYVRPLGQGAADEPEPGEPKDD